MRKFLIILFAIMFVFAGSQVFAGDATLNRDEIIADKLDCFSSQMKSQASLKWSDVCATDNSSAKRSAEVDMDTEGNISIRSYNNKNFGGRLTNLARFFDRDNPLIKFEMGSEAFFTTYREPSFMRQKGYMFGVYGVYSYRTRENKHINSLKDAFTDQSKINLFRLESSFSQGMLDYESEGTGKQEDIDNYQFEIRGIGGYDFPMKHSITLTPFFGIAFRYLLDDGGGQQTTTGHWSYDRESRYVYLPLGLETNWDFKEAWSLTVTMEYDIFIHGKQKSHLEDVDPSYSVISNKQDNGEGIRASIKLAREGEKFDLLLEPFFRYWSIKDSEISSITYSNVVVGYGQEPENTTFEFGFKAGIRY